MAGESLRGKVFEKLRNDILRGRYKKGDELVAVSYTHLLFQLQRFLQ